MRTAEFDYALPPELIAQTPATKRDHSRLFVLQRATRQWAHRHFYELGEYLRDSDVLVLNNSRVIPARLHGIKEKSGGRLEILLLEEITLNEW